MGYPNSYREDTLGIKLSKEDYRRIMLDILDGKSFDEIDGIDEIKAQMTEDVMFSDCWFERNGKMRSKPLKKEREIENISFDLTEDEYSRIKKMKDPKAVYSRPEEHMTIYRNDGSSVTISTENGKVIMSDSRTSSYVCIMENDHFLDRLL
jgi:hypothetical protein